MADAQSVPERAPRVFPIVGLGASAGGLRPTVEFLAALGNAPGVAVVVVHHLDSQKQSRLVDILAHACALPVSAAAAGQVVEKNHVYVIQPGSRLVIEHGMLTTCSRPETPGHRRLIDRFLESLAKNGAGMAVAVVLSGADSDGTAGVRAVKSAGGLTLAQDESAEYRSMPDSAVATGCVDFVQSPAALARRVKRFATSGEGAVLRSSATSGEGAPLREQPPVPVTSFFHDAGAFEAVDNVILPRLLAHRQRDTPLRVWVTGCATGEEAYGLAIVVLEYFDKRGERPPPITIFGTDASENAILQARRGRYPGSIAADVSPERLAQFFVEDMGHYCIRPQVRSLCVFAAHDLVRDPPLSQLDLVSCRSVDASGELDERVLSRLHYALREPGFLLLGGAQRVGQFPGFAAVEGTSHVYTRTSAVPPRIEGWARTPHGSPAAVPTAAAPQRSLRSEARREADRILAERFAPPGVIVSEDRSVLEFRGQTGRFLAPAQGTATLDLLRLVREELRLPLRRALDRARVEQVPARAVGVVVNDGSADSSLEVEVVPLPLASAAPFYAISFRELAAEPAPPAPSASASYGTNTGEQPSLDNDIASIRGHLESTIEQLEIANEELHVANEEVISGNEELRCANEELESIKDALSTTNEELRSVNQELCARNGELAKLNDDLTNVLASSAIPLALLDRDGRVRRLTHSAFDAFGLRPEDAGSAVEDTGLVRMLPSLKRQLAEVLEQLRPLTSTIANEAACWFECTLRPYVTGERSIDGVVITANNVDAVRTAAQKLDDARRYAESIVDTIREALVVFGPHLEVRSVNAAFEKLFGMSGGAALGRRLDTIGVGALAQPALLATLEALGAGQSVSGIRLEQPDAELGRRLFDVSARRIAGTDLTLLTVDDVTSRELAQGAVRRTERGFRDMLLDAGEAIIMSEADQHPFFANRAALELFGYSEIEILSCSLERLLPELDLVRDATLRTGARPDVFGHRKDGTEFPARVVVSRALREQRPATVVFVTDVTQEREAQRERQAYEETLQRMGFETVLAEERERRRLALALHDRVGQSLALARIKLASASTNAPEALRVAVTEGAKIIDEAIAATRTLTFDLSPPVLYDLGLKAGVSWLAEDFENRYGLKVEVNDDGSHKPLDDAASAVVFRAIRELLMNVVKHAQAPKANVTLSRDHDDLVVEVADDGAGFDERDGQHDGFGLLSVRQQMSRLGGLLEVKSQNGRGTCARLRLSLAEGDPGSARAGMEPP